MTLIFVTKTHLIVDQVHLKLEEKFPYANFKGAANKSEKSLYFNYFTIFQNFKFRTNELFSI